MTERRGGPTISGEGVRMYKDGGGGEGSLCCSHFS